MLRRLVSAQSLRVMQGLDKESAPDLQGSGAQDACSLILCHVPRGDSGSVRGLCLLFQDLHAILSLRKPLLGPILFIVCLHTWEGVTVQDK